MMEDQDMNLYILKEWKRLEIKKSHIGGLRKTKVFLSGGLESMSPLVRTFGSQASTLKNTN